MRLDELLRTKARETPNCLALMEMGGRRCDYQELHRSAQLAGSHLRKLGVGAGDRVGLCAPKCIATVGALFGILNSGAAYVPVDPDALPARNAAIFSDCEVRLILVDPKRRIALHEALTEVGYQVCRNGSVLGLEIISAKSPKASTDEDLAYILYTSGSTGRPKGVSHTHASAFAFIDWCSKEFRPSNHDYFSSHAPLHFDLSIFDIYVAIKHGAAIRLIGADEGRNPRAIAHIIAAENLTVWYSTPTILRALVEHSDLKASDSSLLRLVCFAGEVFPTKHLRALAALLPNTAFYNLYGPTETNVCTFHRVEARGGQTNHLPIPIGTACSGAELKVIDPDGRPVRTGLVGELVVAGPSVMKGYWGAAEVTASIFVMIDGLKWYRTGDNVIEGEGGLLQFRGRNDRMIKRRGFRIELGEIEAALTSHKHISQAAVVASSDVSGDVRIVAYYVWMTEVPSTFVEMKRYCSRALPVYMSPDFFRKLPDMLYTTTGKIDYRRLQEMANELLSN